ALLAERSCLIHGSGCLRGSAVGLCYLVDDALNDYHLHVDVAGHIGQELADQVADRRGSKGRSIAFRGGSRIRRAPGNIEAADLVTAGETEEVRVVRQTLAVVAGRPVAVLTRLRHPV